ncbi:MAG TPA: hypothetical protein VHO91_18490 [Rhodopila sp.]|nr:hypothetical protein [Rhodopila sp.]
MRLLPIVLALLSFTGCALIDQRTFAPAPEAKAQTPPPPPPAAIDPRTPLVTIDYSIPSPDYGELLHDAVRAAQSRDAEVQYDVVAVVQDMSSAAEGQQRAMGVMRAIMRDRVPATRIHLGLRADPTLTADRVLVYVR